MEENGIDLENILDHRRIHLHLGVASSEEIRQPRHHGSVARNSKDLVMKKRPIGSAITS